MRENDDRSRIDTPTELLLRRMEFHESMTHVQTAALFVVACAFSVTSLVTREQAWVLASNFSLVILLIGCTALVFFTGLYAIQRASARRIHAEAYTLFRRNQTDLSQIILALDGRIGNDNSSSRSRDQ